MEGLVQGKPVRGVAREQVRPGRPEPEEILAAVARAFGVCALAGMLYADRSSVSV